MNCKNKLFGHNFIRTGFDYCICSQCGIDQRFLNKPKLKTEEIKESKIRNERQLVLKDFLDKLNRDRERSGFKPYTPAYLGMKLAHLTLEDMYFFLSECRHAKNFSKYFHWALKVEK